MENASKALLMGAGMLLGLLIIFVATRMFSSASKVTESYHSQESSTEVAMFNKNFTKYIGATRGEESIETRFATIHDIITTANFAWDYNRKKALQLDIDPIKTPNENELIHIQLCKLDYDSDTAGDIICSNFENLNDKTYQEYIKKGYYVSSDNPDQDYIINYEILITEYNPVGKIKTVKFYPSKYNGTKLASDKKSGDVHTKSTMEVVNKTLSGIIQKEKVWKK